MKTTAFFSWAGLALSLGLIACENSNPTQTSSDKLGFLIERYSNGFHSDSTGIHISTMEYLEEIPRVTVNGKVPETNEDNLTQWSYDNIHQDSAVRYRIEWNGDVIEGRIEPLKGIDSLFCNGQYIPNTASEETLIESAATYEFAWKPADANGQYRIYYRGSEVGEGATYRTIKGAEVSLPSDPVTSAFPTSILFIVSDFTGRSTLMPEASSVSDKMFVIARSYGSPYEGLLVIDRSGEIVSAE